MNGLFIENFHIVAALSPSSDVYNTNPATDIVNMENYQKAVFVLHQKKGTTTTGTATIKAEASNNALGSSVTNIAFKYAKKATGASDTMGSPTTAVAADGFTTTANEDTIYVIEIDARDLPSGKPYVRLTFLEVVNAPVLGGVMCFLAGGRYGFPFSTALT